LIKKPLNDNIFKMIQRQTWLTVTDGTNIIWTRTFHLYRNWKRSTTYLSYFIKSSVRITKPPIQIYKGFKRKFYIKGRRVRGLIVITKKWNRKSDASYWNYNHNAQIIIRLKKVVKSKYFYGYAPKLLKRKRFLILFSKKIKWFYLHLVLILAFFTFYF